LKFALGKREDKTENEINKERKEKPYNPMNDPMMPRLFRKIGHQTGKLTSRSNMTSASKSSAADWENRVSTYDNLESVSKTGAKEKYTLV